MLFHTNGISMMERGPGIRHHCLERLPIGLVVVHFLPKYFHTGFSNNSNRQAISPSRVAVEQ